MRDDEPRRGAAPRLDTRAVVSGRRTFEHAGHWQGDHHDGVPVFDLTHHVPAEAPPGSVRFVTDLRGCAARARAAADPADVVVMGAGAGPTELELTRVLDAGDTDLEHRVLHLRYRIRGPHEAVEAGS